MHRRILLFAVMSVAMLAALLAPASALAAKPAVDLVVSKVAKAPKSGTQGKLISIKGDTVRNSGSRTAAKSVVRYYLVKNATKSIRARRSSKINPRVSFGDIRLMGSRAVPKLGARASNKPKRNRATKVRIPVDVPAGRYTLLVCADDRGSIRERSETNNCKAAAGKVKVREVAPDMEVTALSEHLAPEVKEDQIAGIIAATSAYCPKQGTLPRRMSKAAAIASIRKKIQKQVGAKRMRELTKAAGKTASSAQRVAAAAAAEKAPAAGVLAMIRAHELQPKEASHLVGAAGIATTIGFHREALALLDAAEPLDDLRQGGFGISNDVAALHNRASALLALNRFKDALPLFEAALEREPLLAESAKGIVRAAACSGKPARAVKRYRQSTKRTKKEQPPAPLADYQKGKANTLPAMLYPLSSDRAAFYYEEFRKLEGEHSAYITWKNQQERDLQTYRRGRTDVSAATTRFEDAIIASAYDELLSGEARDLSTAATNSIDPAHAYRIIQYCVDQAEGAKGCDGHSGTVEDLGCGAPTNLWNERHNEMLKASWEAKQAAYARRSQIVNAHAALIEDPKVREFLLVRAIDPYLHMAGLWQAGNYWTREAKSHNLGCQPEIDGRNDAAPGQRNDPNACDEEAQKLAFVADFKIVKIKVNCASISVGADSSVAMLGMLGAFAEFSYSHGSGELTIVAGARAGATVRGNGAEFKSGVYATVGANGVSDVGMRVGPSVSVTPGQIAEYGISDNMDFTFLSAPQ